MHSPSFTLFQGSRRLATGPLAEVALEARRATLGAATDPLVIFEDATGRPIDLDLRGGEQDIIARLHSGTVGGDEQTAGSAEPRRRGRPKLGVVAREVTLLPRHWEWLARQPGGASVALRRLVEAARRAGSETDRIRAARDAAYHFMSVMAGNLAGFEEASRALFGGDHARLDKEMAGWPVDIRDHLLKILGRQS